jgi:hypothetical protein
MPDLKIWRAGFASLRSRFEKAASDHIGVRCSLTRESFASGDGPVAAAAMSGDALRGLRPIIGAQADGIHSVHAGQIARGDDIYTWWFVHDRLMHAQSSARILPEFGVKVFEESERARECTQMFLELAEEGGRMLKEMRAGHCQPLDHLLQTTELTFGHLLWLVALFEVARRRLMGELLRVSISSPRIVEVDIFAAFSEGEAPDSAILNLDCNPFSGSVALIDLVTADEKTDKSKKVMRKLPRDEEVLKAAKFVLDYRRRVMKDQIPQANLKEILTDYADGDEKAVARLTRQLQPSRYGWLLEISEDAAD